MSFEKSIETLAESNLKLAAAMDKYATTIEKFGLKIEQANTVEVEEDVEEEPAPKTAAKKTAAKKTAAKKTAEPEPEPEPEPEEDADDDGFGEEEDETPDTLTAEDVRKILLAVRDKTGDKADAIAICIKFGYKGIPDIKEKDYAKVYAAAKAKLAS